MNLPLPAPQVPEAQIPIAPPSAAQRSWPRLLVNILVALVVLAVAAAAFVLSYSGVHAVAIAGGVSVRLARVYPALFDAVLVIACVAAVMLSGGRWWARCWAWLVIIVVLAAIGATDAAHAANYPLPHRQTEGVVAAAPVLAVLLAFSLLITLLRSSRTQPLSAAPSRRAARRAAKQQAAVIPVKAPRPPAPPIALPAAAAPLPAPAPMTPLPTAPSSVLEEPAAPSLAPAPAPEPAAVPEEPAVTPADDLPRRTPDNAVSPDMEPEPEPAADVLEVDQPRDLAQPHELAPATDTTSDAADAADADADAETDSGGQRRDQAREQTSGYDYWDADVDARLAGQVYPVEATDTAVDMPAEQVRTRNFNGDGHENGCAKQPQAPELDDDAPSFATAPFATIPRLNRVRATPIPPADADAGKDADT